MKIYISILLLFVITLCNAQTINIPDANFKAKLLTATYSNYVAGTGWVSSNPTASVKIDTNNDFQIQQNEVANITYLNIDSSNISSLEGLQYFTNLKLLFCNYNTIAIISPVGLSNLEGLNIGANQLSTFNLSGFTNLKIYNCSGNLFTSLDFSGLPSLEDLSCLGNQLTSLNISNLTNLTRLNCQTNQLTNLDLSNNPLISNLVCNNNLITNLDLRNNPLISTIGCGYNNNLTSIFIKNGAAQTFNPSFCWLGNPNLNYICADPAEIPALQSFLASCGITQPITIDSSCTLGTLDFGDAVTVSITPNPSNGLYKIDFNNALAQNTTIEVYNLLGQKIYENNINNTDSYLLDITSIASGNYLLKISYNGQVISKKLIKL
jgi:Leucine-rich repeat (LRR) protein